MDFDYKKYSLQKLEEWVHDAISTSEATPQEIYDVIKNVVDENYHTHKLHTSRCYELLALLNGNGKGHLTCDKDDPSPECKGAWNDFWEENCYPEEYKGSTVSSVQYTEEELNAMCDHAEKQEKQRQMTYDEAIAAGWEMTADGFWFRETPKDKVTKWQLPVEVDGASGEYYFNFPDDLLEAANLKEGDQVEWIDNGDGSYILRKVSQTVCMDKC